MKSARVTSLDQLARRAAEDAELRRELSEKPVETLARLAAPLRSDAWIYRIVVSALGLVALLAVGGAALLAYTGKSAPEGLIAIGSAAVGALAGLLAPSPSR
ncbi:MAG: hypothetical protein HUU04_11150 [Verrucomicrobiae bacterium]|nr:hypothetical protein [Verrucomicrobiae bacterium]